jgi:hypothetical protein
MKNLRKLNNDEIVEIETNFLKKFPSPRLSALLNIDRDYTLHCTQWNVHKDQNNHIVGKKKKQTKI